MIVDWKLQTNEGSRAEVKKLVSQKKYNCVDVGAGVNYWSFPECLAVVDIMDKQHFPQFYDDSKVTIFSLDLQNTETWGELLQYVEINGKFDYSICSHTLEDIVNPFQVVKLLTDISKRGFIAIPTKYDEFRVQYDNKFRGNPHHKYIFDVIDNKLVIAPKLSFIESNDMSDYIGNLKSYQQLSIFWEESIEYVIEPRKVYYSNSELINGYYEIFLKNLENEKKD